MSDRSVLEVSSNVLTLLLARDLVTAVHCSKNVVVKLVVVNLLGIVKLVWLW